ncbi:MAG: hydroxymethylglutaryl-CoA lyase [Desulfobacterales bacterium]
MKIVEVGPRDGLQNETATVPTEAKVAFVNALSLTGVGEIEVSAFVSPRRVPQLGDADDVFRKIDRKDGVVYSALVPNEKGFDRAAAARVDKISVFTAASETFNRKNINTSGEGALRRFRPLIKRARDEKLPVRGYVSTAFWCPFEGQISPETTVEVVKKLVHIGVDEVSISDTVGKATPEEVSRLFDRLLPEIATERIAVHFHDTYGRGVENVLTSLSYGIRIFDASTGGIGGCPFAPGATGNVATEAVVEALENNGKTVGVDLRKLSQARHLLDAYLREERRTLPEGGSQACAVCEFYQGEVCCGRWKRQN